MDRTVSKIYTDYSADTVSVIEQSLTAGLQSRQEQGKIPLFFRADDVGVPSEMFSRMLGLFSEHHAPLNLAVVPAWLTQARWTALSGLCRPSSSLWCWHQHGWRHKNHESAGKKCEFGMSRPPGQIKSDIIRGKNRLTEIMGSSFCPFFTPPWNRCSPATIEILHGAGFMALSRSRTSRPETSMLPDLAINVDLHTRKEADSRSCLENLADEFARAARSGHIGIMLHHQRMNENAFTVLDGLLRMIVDNHSLQPVLFSETMLRPRTET